MNRLLIHLILTFALCIAQIGNASSPPLPLGSILFNSNHEGDNHEIFRMDLATRQLQKLTNDPKYDASWPRMSPDRTQILFQRTPKGGGGSDYKRMSLWMMNANGSNVRLLRDQKQDGWAMQGHTEWSRSGQSIALFGGPKGMNPQLYVADVNAKQLKQITHRSGQNLDPSWAPDDEWIAFVGCPSAICFAHNYEIFLIRTNGSGEAVRLTNDDLRDHDPYFSPDGKHIAWLTKTLNTASANSSPLGSWGIRIATVGGSGTIRTVIDDGNINSYPAWSPDAQWIYFHRLVYGAELKGFHIYRIRPDGTGLEGMTTHLPGTQEYPNLY